MKTLTELRNEFNNAKENERKAYKALIKNRNVNNFEKWRESRYLRNELLALINSW